MAIELTILYRGPLSSCIYNCHYCPFAKRVETAEQLAADRRALRRFVDWVETRGRDRLSVFFTPWGEGLTRRWYREAIVTLSRLPQIEKVAIQTNLSCPLDWIDRCDTQRLRLWCTYHPTQASRQTFTAKCHQLLAQEVLYSVGVVGLKEHFEDIEALRRELSAEVYLWINAYKHEASYYDEEDVRRCEAVDPYFRINNTLYASRGRRCQAGETAISVDGQGTLRRCHFIERPLGNIYRHDFEDALQARTCTNDTCNCHIGYVYLEDLQLDSVFGDGLLERIPCRPVWRDEDARREAVALAKQLAARAVASAATA